jgi:hypothetical protein
LAVAILVVVLGALATVSFSSSAFGKNKLDEECTDTRIYQHTYDEVFQAAQDAIERKGWFVTNADKDKGTISGHMESPKVTLEIHVEPVSPKPETRVTFSIMCNSKYRYRMQPVNSFLSLVQKVLATYR